MTGILLFVLIPGYVSFELCMSQGLELGLEFFRRIFRFVYLYIGYNLYRSSHQRCSMKKGVLRNFAKFTGKHLYQSLFLTKLQASGLWRAQRPEESVTVVFL